MARAEDTEGNEAIPRLCGVTGSCVVSLELLIVTIRHCCSHVVELGKFTGTISTHCSAPLLKDNTVMCE